MQISKKSPYSDVKKSLTINLKINKINILDEIPTLKNTLPINTSAFYQTVK